VVIVVVFVVEVVVFVVVVVVAVVVTTVPEEVQSATFVLFTHPEKPLLADGHGNVPPPEPAKPGQHWSPAHMLPEPGHCTWAPTAQVPCNSTFCAREPLKELDTQLVTFVLFTHPEKPLLADGHGNVPPPEPAKPGQHWSPEHMLPEPGHCTSAPILQVPPRAPTAPRANMPTSTIEHTIETTLQDY
jgi:hypothetical protein